MMVTSIAPFYLPNPNPSQLFPPIKLRKHVKTLTLSPSPRREWRAGGAVKAKKKKEEKEGEGAFSALEAEVLDFMERSKNPRSFPTKEELVAAGRTDLAAAIASSGGWLAFGWDSKEPDTIRPMETDEGDEGGIEGILSRLERERSLSFGFESSREKDDVLSGNDAVKSIEKSDGPTTSESGSFHQSWQVCCDEITSEDVNVYNVAQSAPNTWRMWSLQRAGNPVTEFEAAEIVPDEERIKLARDFTSADSVNAKMNSATKSIRKFGDRSLDQNTDAKESGQNQLQIRLQHLESELSSSLHSLRSGTNGAIPKGIDSSVEELHRLSDAREFKETEIMRARDKLRSTRAKLAVLEGKMALEIIEAQKIIGERRKRLDAAKKATCLLRSVCIVWSSAASEVLLVGSFDGWTSQRRMERSNTGIFSLQLRLYPGRYEIKFIVDGAWRIDPLRPIVQNNGHENNVLIVT